MSIKQLRNWKYHFLLFCFLSAPWSQCPTTLVRRLSMWSSAWPQLYTPFRNPTCSAKPQTTGSHSLTQPPDQGGKNEAINKITTIWLLSFREKTQLFSCGCVIISLSGSPFSLGTEAVVSLPKPHSLSAHRQCYATANYFHSAPTKPWWLRGREKERQGKQGK